MHTASGRDCLPTREINGGGGVVAVTVDSAHDDAVNFSAQSPPLVEISHGKHVVDPYDDEEPPPLADESDSDDDEPPPPVDYPSDDVGDEDDSSLVDGSPVHGPSIVPNNLEIQVDQYRHLIKKPVYNVHRGGGRKPMSEHAQLAHLKKTIVRRNAAANNRNRLVQFQGYITRGNPCSILVDSGVYTSSAPHH